MNPYSGDSPNPLHRKWKDYVNCQRATFAIHPLKHDLINRTPAAGLYEQRGYTTGHFFFFTFKARAYLLLEFNVTMD